MPWLKTRPTAEAAGCSDRTLKRNMDFRGGCLNLGEHYRHGPSANSSYLWNVELVIEALAHRGLVAAKGRELLPIQEMVSPPQSQIANEFRGADDQEHAPTRTPKPRDSGWRRAEN